ncbi:family 16 glycosylhydrolase [Mesorhizobium sp. L103C131B0]|uniref:family 16 glycosylhydrolase n=1 Tax=Mesorhizobium sp. L103C131B0 TaxID=1287089 RepID=UPI0018CBB85A|nr:family 16 glycosylhydrolase [Mesorhizobium sp. L103C131B0]
MGAQLFVQPDARLQECFGLDEPIRMTRQEVAVARSHIEAWKAIANGSDGHVLVLEDDIWFRRGAATAIDRGWRAALERCGKDHGPPLLYLSYRDAGGTAERIDECEALFRPVRGLWFLSGYVLSPDGAAALLRSMPVVGPADLWINHRLSELGALALASPAILQREDGPSDNSYSVLPYLARAGIVDSGSGAMRPDQAPSGQVLAWSSGGQQESLAMALSMLGLRVRAFDGDEKPIDAKQLSALGGIFDALVDAPLTPEALSAAIKQSGTKFIVEPNAAFRTALELKRPSRLTVLNERQDGRTWAQLCAPLGLTEPVHAFPIGTPRTWRMFRDDRSDGSPTAIARTFTEVSLLDDSPWVLPAQAIWERGRVSNRHMSSPGTTVLAAGMDSPSPWLKTLVETFPGNLASFATVGLRHGPDGVQLTLSKAIDGVRPFQSGAFASTRPFGHGRFEAEIKAAPGSGLVTGFFLHRESPRQEIDVELSGNDPQRMLVNVYFNPGDEGSAMGFGYRGSPCRIELGFDATEDFHTYAIEWRPNTIIWSVDGHVVHERVSWDPTPVPHLPMHRHGNLWVPRSEELAGPLDEAFLPATAHFRNASVCM